jgi:hypothetical protein
VSAIQPVVLVNDILFSPSFRLICRSTCAFPSDMFHLFLPLWSASHWATHTYTGNESCDLRMCALFQTKKKGRTPRARRHIVFMLKNNQCDSRSPCSRCRAAGAECVGLDRATATPVPRRSRHEVHSQRLLADSLQPCSVSGAAQRYP